MELLGNMRVSTLVGIRLAVITAWLGQLRIFFTTERAFKRHTSVQALIVVCNVLQKESFGVKGWN